MDGTKGKRSVGLPEETHWLSGFQALTDGRADADTFRPLFTPMGHIGYGFRHPGANGMQVQDSKTIGKRKAPVPRGGGGTLEDRRSIPGGCGQHVPGLDTSDTAPASSGFENDSP